ncbi:MAG TPA: UDP-N-acetylmuramoyl-L-alanyl-D-glutamate--2,6-diaminopimelate ligase [Acidimicrobiia bacterium]|nr:UDP-N-acetylmuramoyl-L-alanyl-D-glutamate--2,6-diaminopimelate ligase [Acidimicrobiia bacterium]
MASTGSTLARLAAVSGGAVVGDDTIRIGDVTHDSRQVGPATLFVAVPGEHHDGHAYVPVAVASGAPAVMVEHEAALGVPQLVVGNTRVAMAPVSAEVHGHPSSRCAVVGVTGTNGKTTVTHMVEAIAAASGRVSGLIGTVHTRVGGDNIPNTRTTPEAPDFQRLLATMVEAGAAIVAAEVSSHALQMHRVDATVFAVAAFTNLSQDHLDFHGDMESYFAAKARLFESERSRRAVIWVDDPAGARLRANLAIPCLTVGSNADVMATGRQVRVDGSTFRLSTPDGERMIDLPIGGGFNVDNAAVAAGCALSLGIGLDAVAAGLSGFEGVPGRFEVVSDDAVQVVVDYAHTPAGIGEAISAARAAGSGRVIAVFGAGGDRDRAKRPHMGAAAGSADVVVVTSDNPRHEDPEAIVDEVMAGLGDRASVHREVDRRRAIFWAIDEAGDGDMVLILGRGHERGQEIAGRSVPFSDRLVAREALASRRGTRP